MSSTPISICLTGLRELRAPYARRTPNPCSKLLAELRAWRDQDVPLGTAVGQDLSSFCDHQAELGRQRITAVQEAYRKVCSGLFKRGWSSWLAKGMWASPRLHSIGVRCTTCSHNV